MPKAHWNGAVIAQCDASETVEGSRYFPATAVKREHLRPSTTRTECHGKGTASDDDVVVDGNVNKDAGWYCAEPTPAAANIKGYVAFWRGVTVEGRARDCDAQALRARGLGTDAVRGIAS